jgi:hypothetical protein
MEILIAMVTISLILVTIVLSLQVVYLMKLMKRPVKKITSTNRSVRGSRSKELDNDGDITAPIQAIINAAKHNTLSDNPEEAEEELNDQQKEDIAKKERIRQKQIEEAIIQSTQRQNEAIAKTFEDIMDGPVMPEPPKKKEGKQ